MDKSKKGHSKLIIACSDPAENFKFIEETLNQVAFLIGVEIAEPRLDHITFGWDRIRCSLLCDVSANGICSVCFITQNVASGNFHSRKQIDGGTGIKDVSAGKQKVDGISQCIHNSMPMLIFRSILEGKTTKSPTFISQAKRYSIPALVAMAPFLAVG